VNVPASFEDPDPFGEPAMVGLRQVQRALRTLRTTVEREASIAELVRLLLEVLYPLVDLAREKENEALFVELTTAADAVATLCDFERLRPDQLNATQIGRVVDERQKYWARADAALQLLLRDLT
jgi:hypothetical protein